MPKSRTQNSAPESKTSFSEHMSFTRKPIPPQVNIEDSTVVGYMADFESIGILGSIPLLLERGYTATIASLSVQDSFPIEGSLLLDLLLVRCKNTNIYWNLKIDLDLYQEALIMRLVDPDILDKLIRHLISLDAGGVATDFFVSLFRDYCFQGGPYKGMNFLGYCIYSKNLPLLSYLLGKIKTDFKLVIPKSIKVFKGKEWINETKADARRVNKEGFNLEEATQQLQFEIKADILNPQTVGSHFTGTMVHWLLTLCTQDKEYYSFFQECHPILSTFINKYNHKHTLDSRLPFPLLASEGFSPLAYILSQGKKVSQGNKEFAFRLMESNKQLPWLSELGRRTKDGICPLWIPYLPKKYSFENTYMEHLAAVSAGVDVKKLLSTLLSSLTSTNDLGEFSDNERNKIKTTAKSVFEKLVNHPPLFALLKDNCSEGVSKDVSGLPQLYSYSKDKMVLEKAPKLADSLQDTTELAQLLDLYGVIHLLTEPKFFSSAKDLLGKMSRDDLLSIVKLLEYILSFYDPTLLNSYLESPEYASFNLQSKMLSIPAVYRKELTILLKRMQYDVSGLEDQLEGLERSLLNLKGTEEAFEIDTKIAEIRKKVEEIDMEALSASLKRICSLREKCTISKGILVNRHSSKKTKQLAKVSEVAAPQASEAQECKTLDAGLTETTTALLAALESTETKPEDLPLAENTATKPKKAHKVKPTKPGSQKKLGKNSKLYLGLPEPELRPEIKPEPKPKHQSQPRPVLPVIETKLRTEDLSQQPALVEKIEEKTVPIPAYPINTVFKEYLSLYLREMHAEISDFTQSLIRLYTTEPERNGIAKKANFKAINHIAYIESAVANILSCLPQTENKLSADDLWNIMGLADSSKNTSIASVKKFKTIFENIHERLGRKPISKILKSFHVWNDFIGAHLDTLEALQSIPEVDFTIEDIRLKVQLNALAKSLHWGFLPHRYLTASEDSTYNFVVNLVRSYTRTIARNRIGHIQRILEHGTQIYSHFLSKPSFCSDMDIVIELSSFPLNFEALANTLEEIKGIYPGIKASNTPKYKAKDGSVFQWELSLPNGFKIDLQFCFNKPYEATIAESVFPYAMLAADLNNDTRFNPVNSLELLNLFSVLNKSPAKIEAWVNDPTKIAFILRGVSKAYRENIPEEPMLFLMSMVQKSINNMLSDPNKMNPITYLFGRPSIRMAGFHALLMKYDLARIFDLSLTEDRAFLEWFDKILQGMEDQEAGATRPCRGLMSTEDYMSIILHYILQREIKKNPDPAERPKIIQYLKKIERRCLYTKPGEPLPKAVETAEKIEEALAAKSFAVPLGDHFPLRRFYEVPVAAVGMGTLFNTTTGIPANSVANTTSTEPVLEA